MPLKFKLKMFLSALISILFILFTAPLLAAGSVQSEKETRPV